MIDFAIVDAHHHFQELRRSYPWLEGESPIVRYHGNDLPLRRDYVMADYRADVAPLALAGSVHIENGAADPAAESDWIDSLASVSDVPLVHVARVDLCAADAAMELERIATLSSVRGVRFILNWHEDPVYTHVSSPSIMHDRLWRENFARLSGLNLSFDLQVFPDQLLDAAALAAAFPNTSIVLDHVGMPIRRDPQGVAEWRAGIQAMAAQPNVTVKISALGTNDHNWTLDSIRPFVLDSIDAFGAERAMFGSNFPVDSLYSNFQELYSAFDQITASLSRDERLALFARTAARVYRLEPGITRGK